MERKNVWETYDAKEQKKLQSISSLTTEIGFVFCVYKKQPYVG